MSSTEYYGDEVETRHGYLRVPTIAVAAILSLLLHLGLILVLPSFRKTSTEPPVPPPMTAYLQQTPSAPAAERSPTPPTPPRARPQPAKPRPAPPSPRTPPLIALPRPAAPNTTPPPAVPAPPVVVPPVVAPNTDFMASIEARRRARGEISDEDQAAADAARANRGIVASAARKGPAPITFEDKTPTHGGGLFDIRRRGYDYAEFMFFGWNENFRRAVPQMIEVRKGDNADIDIAVVRRIIALIREKESSDFQWYSKRTGRQYTLSARARDNGYLEDFMMREFYDDLHRYR